LAYYRIANHYKFIMKTFFDCFQYPKLIILEVRNPISSCRSCWLDEWPGTKRYR
jgi:hypothetical protein